MCGGAAAPRHAGSSGPAPSLALRARSGAGPRSVVWSQVSDPRTQPSGYSLVLLALELALSESAALWRSVLDGLIRRGLLSPKLLVSDGHAVPRWALAAWPAAKVQRCTQHKLRNLLAAFLRHARAELERDWNRIIRAKDGLAARKAHDAFAATWRPLCPAVVNSLDEGKLEPLTFYEFPRAVRRGSER
ncbi:MAG: hypothetical protein D6718_05050 [Acidobacteria bacterium]|nr:MAG: hypothetical protein D6718_05050 [Acidobacteriota bacterium]